MKSVTLLQKYVEAREKRNKYDAKCKAISAEIQADLIKNKLLSIKSEDGSQVATRAKKTLRYVDQSTAFDYLSQREDIDVEVYTQLNEKKYLNLAEAELKMTGELLPGITTDETEYLYVGPVKEKK